MIRAVGLVAVTAFVLAIATGWLRPTGPAVPILALTLLGARIAVALFGTRRADARGGRARATDRDTDSRSTLGGEDR
jgi:hypothetical protein